MKYCIIIRDSNGKDISNHYRITPDYSVCGDTITIQLLDESHFRDAINVDEIYLLMSLLEKAIEYGDSVPKIRKMLEVFDKLEKLLEKNSINE